MKKKCGLYKIKEATDWAYLACVVDLASWRLHRNPNGSAYVNYILFSSRISTELNQWFSELFHENVCYRWSQRPDYYISKEEGGPAKRVRGRVSYLYIKIGSAREMLFLIEKTEPYLRVKKPYIHVTKEFLKSKIYNHPRYKTNEHEKRMKLIEEFEHIRKIHEQGREDGI